MQTTSHHDHAGHHPTHHHPNGNHAQAHARQNTKRYVSWSEAGAATLHCLTGCAIGEASGLIIGTALNLSNSATIALAITLAFVCGFALTMRPLLKSGMPLRRAAEVALAADVVSISVMEVVNNGIMLVVPGAMDAALTDPLFWGTMIVALAIAAVAAWPVNRYLISRGKGHAVVHQYHCHH